MSAQTTLRRRYPLLFQLSLLLALALTVTAFSVPFGLSEKATVIVSQDEIVQVVDIEPTRHAQEPPPPRPPAPVEVPDDEVLDDVLIDIDIPDLRTEPAVIPPRPDQMPAVVAPPEPEDPDIFIVVEQPPVLLPNEAEGLRQLQSRIQYPEMARRAGIEGTVFVQFVVDENGNVNNPVCARDPGGNTCEEALRAVREAKFKPGRQRGKPVKVRFSLPVRFRLR